DVAATLDRALGAEAIARAVTAPRETEAGAGGEPYAATVEAGRVAELLATLARAEACGRLVLAAGAVEREIWFSRGFVVWARSSALAERFGATAIREGAANAEQVDAALARTRTACGRIAASRPAPPSTPLASGSASSGRRKPKRSSAPPRPSG